MGVVLGAEGLVRDYGRGPTCIRALDGVDLKIEAGTAVAVCGPSGSGKSTLLHVLAGLDTPTEGTVRFGDVVVSALAEEERSVLRRRHFGFVFQSFHLLPTLAAWENVALPLLLDGRPGGLDRVAREALSRVGLADRGDARPGELSGGELQRVAVARALVADPRVIFADEPTGNLDRATGQRVVDLLLEVTAGDGRALVVVTHDSAVADRADDTATLVDGRLATTGTEVEE